jgi:hypothetical protein
MANFVQRELFKGGIGIVIGARGFIGQPVRTRIQRRVSGVLQMDRGAGGDGAAVIDREKGQAERPRRQVLRKPMLIALVLPGAASTKLTPLAALQVAKAATTSACWAGSVMALLKPLPLSPSAKFQVTVGDD